MKPEDVNQLEALIEEAVRSAVEAYADSNHLGGHTFHYMAKAAVAVLEAAIDAAED